MQIGHTSLAQTAAASVMLKRPTRAYDALISIFCEINAVKIGSVRRLSVNSTLNMSYGIRKRERW